MNPARDVLAARLFGGRRLPVLIQTEMADCGLTCVAMIARFHGADLDTISLRRRFPPSSRGSSLLDLLSLAERLGMAGRGLRLEPDQLDQVQTPAILHWQMNHFVVLKAVRRDGAAVLHDPAIGQRIISPAELARDFTGIALELTPTTDFDTSTQRAKLPMRSLWGRVQGLGRALTQAVVLTAVLQVALLAAPFYMQIAVDEVVEKGDSRLLGPLAVGFLLLGAIQFGAAWLRTYVLAATGATLGFEMMARLFHHLIRLPLDFFSRREIGDIISRFGSTRTVRDAVADWAPTSVVDGAMAILLLIAMILYSPALSAVVLAALVVNVVIRLATLSTARALESEMLTAHGREQTSFIETLRGVQSIKLFGREAQREAVWRNLAADSMGRLARSERLKNGLHALGEALYAVENVIIVFLGARAVGQSVLTLGMLFAFVAWRLQFLEKATKLIENAMRWRLLDLHLGRIADIALAEKEPGLDETVRPFFSTPLSGRIRLEGIRYAYDPGAPEILRGIDMEVGAGEFVALTGPSGGGKTTLLKVMIGLIRPTSGMVLIDDGPLDRIGPVAFRSQIGVVMQEDHLLGGSIAENLTCFDPQPDWGWMRECAAAACIDADVMDMAMNYNTLVGDMGTTLSGGQRQRLLLARALYRRPRILFMDEGTSALDLQRERDVNAALAALRITRLVIAHRPETVAAADRVMVLRDGRIERDLHQAATADAARNS
jgi:ATP-binding cassette subfamily B protein RaxB